MLQRVSTRYVFTERLDRRGFRAHPMLPAAWSYQQPSGAWLVTSSSEP